MEKKERNKNKTLHIFLQHIAKNISKYSFYWNNPLTKKEKEKTQRMAITNSL
jgi:hypothetical protein